MRNSIVPATVSALVLLTASCGSSGGTANAPRSGRGSPSTVSTTSTLPPLAPLPATEVTSDRRATAALFAGIRADGPGCTVAVARDGKTLFSAAYGLMSLTDRTPNTPATVMDIGSTSKQFTAYAILMLAADGKLRLDDDIHTYVPQLPDYGVKVTLRDMMHHRSGIPDYVNLLSDRINERTTAADALTALQHAPKLDFAPGTKFEYSNSNYFLFSYVVRRVAHQSLPSYLQENVFRPAGIHAVMDPVGAVPHKAPSYTRTNDGRWVPAPSLWEQVGDGAIQTTPTDLVKWATQYWAPTVGSPAAQRGRLADAPPADAKWGEYGAGIGRKTLPDGTVELSHDGGWAGYSTQFGVIPAQRLAAAMECNGYPLVAVTAAALLDIWR